MAMRGTYYHQKSLLASFQTLLNKTVSMGNTSKSHTEDKHTHMYIPTFQYDKKCERSVKF